MSWVSCQQACLCDAASSQAYVFRIRVSEEQGPCAHYSSHTLDNLIHPRRFLYGPSAVFSSSPDTLPERFTELRLLGQGCGFRLVPLFAWGSCIIPCMAWGQRVESSPDRRWHGLVSFLHLGEGRCQPCFSPLALATYIGRPVTQWSSPPRSLGAYRTGRARPSPENASILLFAELLPHPGTVWVELKLGPSITEEPVQGGSWPGASCSLGEGPGLHSVLSLALALPQLPTWGSCT